MSSFLLPLLTATLAFAQAEDDPTLDSINPSTFSVTRPHDTDQYWQYQKGERFEWTLYGRRYDKPNYGHRFEWSLSGLSHMSVCMERGETGDVRYRGIVEDDHCPQYPLTYQWEVLFDAQPSRCVGLDRETKGQKYRRLADDRRCPKPVTVYRWARSTPGLPVECYEVDETTEGRVYRRPARKTYCAHALDVVVAFGRPVPSLPKPSRAPASVPAFTPAELDPAYRENLPGLEKDGREIPAPREEP